MKPKSKKQAPVILRCGFVKTTITFTLDCNQSNILHKEFDYGYLSDILFKKTNSLDRHNIQNVDKSGFLS